MKITDIIAREVLDSRGNPTVEVELEIDNKFIEKAIVPSGASTGSKEALELRDNDQRYGGKGVLKAVKNINEIIRPVLIGMNPLNQVYIDKTLIKLDNTSDKSKLGANAILGVSLATARCAAKALGMPLYRYLGGVNARIMPVPMMNVLNGGSHADNSVDFQEYMIMPVGAKTFREALEMGANVFHTLKSILKEEGFSTGLGDEGGFAPNFKDNEEPLKYLEKAITKAGYNLDTDFKLALDVAASEFYEDGYYYFKKSSKQKLTSQEMVDYLENLTNKYPIISLEDGLNEEDYAGWKELTLRLGKKIQIVGDDLFVTNPKLIKEGIKEGIANAVLIKINQIGTISETFEAMEIAKRSGYKVIVSHRSGETEDSSIADIAVSFNAGEIKTGSISRSDRIAKYNQLLRIEEDLKDAIYEGIDTFTNINI